MEPDATVAIAGIPVVCGADKMEVGADKMEVGAENEGKMEAAWSWQTVLCSCNTIEVRAREG